MQQQRLRWLVLLVVWGAVLATGSRIGQDFEFNGVDHTGVQALINGVASNQEEKVYVLTKYMVPPSKRNDFMKSWHSMEDKVLQDQDSGQLRFDLKKPRTDNLFFLGYSEWANQQAWGRHMQQPYTQDFVKYTADNDVVWQLAPMTNMTGDFEEKVQPTASVTEQGPVHIVCLFNVPAREHNGFMDKWKQTAKDTMQEQGVRHFALRKIAIDNTKFADFGTWDTMDAFMQHMESKHVKSLLDYIDSKDIYVVTTMLDKLGKQGQF